MKALWSKEKAWKDMNEKIQLTTKGRPVEGSIVSCMWFCRISSVHHGIFSSVSSLFYTHTRTFFPFLLPLSSSSGELLNSCHCLRSKQQSSDGRLNHRCPHELMDTHSQNNPKPLGLFSLISTVCLFCPVWSGKKLLC